MENFILTAEYPWEFILKGINLMNQNKKLTPSDTQQNDLRWHTRANFNFARQCPCWHFD